MGQIQLDFSSGRVRFTVSELNAAIRQILASEFTNILVQGEISGCKIYSSGHCYFTLKDADAQVRAVCFRGDLRLLRVKPADGLAVLARGRLDVFEPRGEYQLIVEALELSGRADLHLAFEQLKTRLQAEGLFDAGRKRPMPRYPRRIGIVTSPQGAVIRDMITILSRRWPGLHVRLYPAPVQGAGSVEALVAGLNYFSESGWADLVIVGRGGGSLEDLWSFNDEAVARAVANCAVPVISAVGHETDFTMADFVADLRAPTPSAAAELAVVEKEELLRVVASVTQNAYRATRFLISRRGQGIDEMDRRLRAPLFSALNERRRRLADLYHRLQRYNPTARLAEAHRRLAGASAQLEPAISRQLVFRQNGLDRESGRLERALEIRLQQLRSQLASLDAALQPLSPQRVLDRGYAIVQTGDKVLRSAAETKRGDALQIRLAAGSIQAEVTNPYSTR